MTRRLRLLSYSSGYSPCGVSDYNRHLMAALARDVDVETVQFPTTRVARHQLRALFAMRREYKELATRANEHDVALLQLDVKYWNGGRPVENMLPVFLRNLAKPALLVLHEWPKLPGVGHHGGSRMRQRAKAGLTALAVSRDLGVVDYARWMERDMFARMHHVLVHTVEFRNRLVSNGLPAERVTCLPFPLHAMPSPCWTPAEVRARFGLGTRRVVLLFGYPVPRKGFDLAVRALSSLPPDIVLVLVCSDRNDHERAQIAELTQLAEAQGVRDRWVPTGYLDDPQLASILATTTLSLAPFRTVTGSSSMSHCFAAGVPVFTSDLPPMRQALADGAGIALYQPESPQAIVDAVVPALASPAVLETMRRANHDYARRHSFERLAELVHALASRAAGVQIATAS